MRVTVRVQHELHPLLHAGLGLCVCELPLLEEGLEVDSHYDVHQVKLHVVLDGLVCLDVSDDLLEILDIRVNYLLPWLYMRRLRPWLVPEHLLEQDLGLRERLLLLTGESLLLLRFHELHLRLLLLGLHSLASLAPLVADLRLELDSPAVVAGASYRDLSVTLNDLNRARPFLDCAGLLDAFDDLDAVVANSVFLGKLPEMMAAARARGLGGLLARLLDVPLASEVRLGSI